MSTCCKVVKWLLVLAVAWLSWSCYSRWFVIPELPVLEEQWWGAGPPTQQDQTIRPFKISFPQQMVDELKQRIISSNFHTPPLEESAFQYGFNNDHLRHVARYWSSEYKFEERQKYMNKFPQFMTRLQGLDIHFVRVAPTLSRADVQRGVQVLPLLMIHGWPGSVLEFYSCITTLTTPSPDRDFVFEVVAPSLPGYAYSQTAARPGLADAQAVILFAGLMTRLGHERFYVQGGDWGGIIGSHMATLLPQRVLGFHSNFAAANTAPSMVYLLLGTVFPSLAVEAEHQHRMYPITKHLGFLLEESGYFHLQATKPDTIGVALRDSPLGLAAYILEKFSTWTNPDNRLLADGGMNKLGISLDQLLDNVMLYWHSRCITSSMRLYAESMTKKNMALQLDDIPVSTSVPVAVARLPHELMFQSERQLRTKFPSLLQVSDPPKGGHFAAMEQPALLTEDIFKATALFLDFHKQRDAQQKQEL